jgi:hypothetical protein
MKVTVHTTNPDHGIEIQSMPDEDVIALVDDFERGDSGTLTFTLDGGSVSHLARAHVVGIDVDPEEP